MEAAVESAVKRGIVKVEALLSGGFGCKVQAKADDGRRGW